MPDEFSARNMAIREALAIAAKDPAAAIDMLAAAMDGVSATVEKAAIAKHAGAICYATGEFQRAAAFYRQAAAADQSDAYAHLALGQVYQQLGRIEDARAALALCVLAIESGGDRDLLDVAARTMSELNAVSDDS